MASAPSGDQKLSASKIVKCFKVFDSNGDGTIAPAQLASVLKSIAADVWTDEQLDQLLRQATMNEDGRIQYEEFLWWLFQSGETQSKFIRAAENIAVEAEHLTRVKLVEGLRELREAAFLSSDKEEAKALLETLRTFLKMLEGFSKSPADDPGRTLQRTTSGNNLIVAEQLFPIRGCVEFLEAVGFQQQEAGFVLPPDAEIQWAVDELRKFIKNYGDVGFQAKISRDGETPKFLVIEDTVLHTVATTTIFESVDSWDELRNIRAGETVIAAGPPENVEGFIMVPIRPKGAIELEFLAAGDIKGKILEQPPPPPQWKLFGSADETNVGELIEILAGLPAMDKKTMCGQCAAQTFAMEDFMEEQVGMQSLPGKVFVQGVKAFKLKASLSDMPPDAELNFKGIPAASSGFQMSLEEVQKWQSSFRIYVADDIYVGDEGMETLRKSIQGLSKAGKEAWMMKFAIRCSINPVLMCFDGKVIDRCKDDPVASRIHLISVCGIDFAARVHDHVDLTNYINNWSEVFKFDKDGAPIVIGGRDFVPTGERASLNVSKTLADLKKMARLRLRAQDDLGIQVVVEVGLGLGVFAGDALGIGKNVRMLSALALKQVIEAEAFKNIKLIVLSLPIFRRNDNYDFFLAAFENSGYKGRIPIVLMDQDMHAIALAAAKAGFTVGELNPADSHGIFGEYWQNLGPGTEEKLALTTCGLLTQHHVVNPCVLDTRNYIPMAVSEPAREDDDLYS